MVGWLVAWAGDRRRVLREVDMDMEVNLTMTAREDIGTIVYNTSSFHLWCKLHRRHFNSMAWYATMNHCTRRSKINTTIQNEFIIIKYGCRLTLQNKSSGGPFSQRQGNHLGFGNQFNTTMFLYCIVGDCICHCRKPAFLQKT